MNIYFFIFSGPYLMTWLMTMGSGGRSRLVRR